MSFMRRKKHSLVGYVQVRKDKDLKMSAKNQNNLKV